jgi:hypothetical protein
MPPPSPTLVAASPPSLTLVDVPPRKVGAKHASPDVLAGVLELGWAGEKAEAVSPRA